MADIKDPVETLSDVREFRFDGSDEIGRTFRDINTALQSILSSVQVLLAWHDSRVKVYETNLEAVTELMREATRVARRISIIRSINAVLTVALLGFLLAIVLFR